MGRKDSTKNRWAHRWNQVLESWGGEARVRRGRSYARQGLVVHLEVMPGKVKARVQGSRPRPYRVTLTLKTFSPGEWERVLDDLVKQPLLLAHLLAGEMPEDMEEAFAQAGLSLLPRRFEDLVLDCSCPDWGNPCKHGAAVFYVLGQTLEEDPFLLLRLRGMDQETFVEALWRKKGSQVSNEGLGREPMGSQVEGGLDAHWKNFWQGEMTSGDFNVGIEPSIEPEGLYPSLENPPFWKGKTPLPELLEEVYRLVSQKAQELIWPEGKGRS